LNCDFDWGHHHMIVWGHDHPRPPGWWHEHGNERAAAFAGHATVWNPGVRVGYGVARGGDRGWNNEMANRSVAHPIDMGVRSGAAYNSHPNNVQVGPAIRSGAETFNRAPEPSTGAFIGSRSPQEARDFSSRGQESMGAAEHSESSFSGASGGSAFHGGGGGGGFHGGGGGFGGGGGGHR